MDYIGRQLMCVILTMQATESTFIKSRLASSWYEAREQCNMFGGRLATLENLGTFQKLLDSKEMSYVLEKNSELWVGANLKQGPWTWDDYREEEFNGTLHFYENMGCYNQQFWLGGTQLESPKPESCLKHCGWQGGVGLKKDYCLCERDLVNISTTKDAICHIPCDGDPSTMCGGFLGVSLYSPANTTVSWAPGESSGNGNCALLKKKSRETTPEFISSNCDMQARYMCSYEYNIACGLRTKCAKSSSKHATWWNAKNACNLTSLKETHVDESYDLETLAPGIYWVALRRQSAWYWLSDVKVRIEYFFPYDTGLFGGTDRTCAVVTMSQGKVGLAARDCKESKYYLCEYESMQKRGGNSPSDAHVTPLADVTNHSTTLLTWVTIGTDTAGEAEPDSFKVLGVKGTVFTCLYLVLGFLSGMICVLLLGLLVYTIYRCNRPDPTKHNRLGDNESGHGTQSVNYSSKDDSLHISPDITYDTVYDLQGESPFRKSQRLIQMGSANSWRHAQSRRVRSDTSDSSGSDYTWRGMIGGKVEIVNTELRHQNPSQFDGLTVSEAQALARSSGRGESLPATIRTRCDVHSENPQQQIATIESLYTLPMDNRSHRMASAVNERNRQLDFRYENRSGSSNQGFQENSLPRHAVSPMQSGSLPQALATAPAAQECNEQSFLELRAARNSDSTEENIYATIKKTFQKIKQDLADEARKDNANEDEEGHVMYSVRLTDL